MKDRPLVCYRSKEEIEAYRKKPAIEKLRWLEAQMEFFYKTMPKKAKKIRDKLMRGEL